MHNARTEPYTYVRILAIGIVTQSCTSGAWFDSGNKKKRESFSILLPGRGPNSAGRTGAWALDGLVVGPVVCRQPAQVNDGNGLGHGGSGYGRTILLADHVSARWLLHAGGSSWTIGGIFIGWSSAMVACLLLVVTTESLVIAHRIHYLNHGCSNYALALAGPLGLAAQVQPRRYEWCACAR
jgi:hypothetical protein